MELVEATADDVSTIAQYWYALAAEMEQYSELNELAHDGPADAVEGIRHHHIEREDTTAYLIAVDDAPVGYLLLSEDGNPSRVHDSYLQIVDLFVAEEHRDEGYGSEVIERVRSIARERGVDYLKLGCEWDNEGARRFYEDNGFEAKQVTYVQRVE